MILELLKPGSINFVSVQLQIVIKFYAGSYRCFVYVGVECHELKWNLRVAVGKRLSFSLLDIILTLAYTGRYYC